MSNFLPEYYVHVAKHILKRHYGRSRKLTVIIVSL